MRRRGWIVSAVIAIAALAVSVEFVAFDQGDDVGVAVVDGVVGAGLLGAGMLAASRRTARRSGLIAAAAGLAWLAGAVWAPLIFAHRGPLAHLYLAYPSGRVRRMSTLVAVLAVYAVSLVQPLAGRVPTMIGVVVVIGAATTWRSARLSGAARPAGLLALAAAGSFAGALMLGALNRWFTWQADRQALWVFDGVVLVTVLVLLVANVWAHWAPSVVTSLVIDLGRPLAGSLRATLAGALGDPALTIGFWDTRTERYVDEAGRTVTATAGRVATTVDVSGEQAAVLVHDAAVLDDAALVDSVTAAARLAIANRRMEAQAHERVDQLMISRRRLVEAADEQRRRLSRELDDEVGARLDRAATLVNAVESGNAVVARVRDELAAARVELDDLARGIHPRVLADDGLAAAVPSLSSRLSLPVSLAITPERFPAAVEAALYFVCAEALTNVVKHAGASRASVQIARHDGTVTTVIADDGHGGADVRTGSGLRGLADRVEALGGTLTVRSESRHGTRLAATIPVFISAQATQR